MLYYIIKVLISAVIIVAVSETAKHSSLFGALIASLPLTSLLAIPWMHVEKVENSEVAGLSRSIFWLVLPSLSFFLLFPYLLDRGTGFWGSLGIASGVTVALYLLLVVVLRHFHITL